ncbi:MAG: hypothetical protein EA401_03990 [Planctomycetota bacterium]|nr:MAG: hypothetical protein EA401_03990 [Planctomycetota bacterium]
MSQADPARQCAWRVLEACERQPDSFAEQWLRRYCQRLSPRDAALARELSLGALRLGLLYDAVMARLLQRPDPAPALRRALRLALHQMLSMDRIPAHAIGASTGSLLRWSGSQRLVAVANAVIRRVIDRLEPGEEPLQRLPKDLWPRDPGLRYGLPPSFVEHVRGGGLEITIDDAQLAACSRCPPLATRALSGAVIDDHPAILRQEGIWTWWSDPHAALAGPVAAGKAVVQDPAQVKALELAGPLEGRLVLDCCAAPGGKSRYLREQGAQVVAADMSRERLARMQSAVHGHLLCADARAQALAPGFALVVADVPCSNSGVWGRRPEARYRYHANALRSLRQLQGSILRAAAQLVAEDGKLLYTTCSLSPGENQEQVRALQGWQIEREQLTWPSQWHAGGYACLLSRMSRTG